MYRNQYDTDVTVFSPQGRLHQVEYADEAVKQGSACLGLVSKELVVLAALKRKPNELASHQEKIFRIDDHMSIAIAGLTADARSLARYMRTECLNHKYVYGSAMTTGRLVENVADKHQACTQLAIRRPYGVGLLVAGFDKNGPHLFQTMPSGNYLEYKAQAIGSRAQSAKTYLEKHFDSFADLGKEELIKHALQALQGTVSGDQELDSNNCSVVVLGKDTPYTLIEGTAVQPYLDLIETAAAPADDMDEAKDGEEEKTGDAMES